MHIRVLTLLKELIEIRSFLFFICIFDLKCCLFPYWTQQWCNIYTYYFSIENSCSLIPGGECNFNTSECQCAVHFPVNLHTKCVKGKHQHPPTWPTMSLYSRISIQWFDRQRVLPHLSTSLPEIHYECHHDQNHCIPSGE